MTIKEDPLHVIITDKETEVEVDHIVKALRIIDAPHAEIHEGEMFEFCYRFDLVADGGSAEIGIQTSNREVHMIFQADTGGDSLATLREEPTYTGGSAMTIHNKHRGNANTSTMTVVSLPIVAAQGTLLQERFLFGGTKNQAFGVSGSTRSEWILAKNKKYLVSVLNQGGAAKNISLTGEGYEEKRS